MEKALMMTKQKMNRDFYEHCVELIESRGVAIREIAEISFDLQKTYCPGITIEDAEKAVRAVLRKREAQFAIMTGLELYILF